MSIPDSYRRQGGIALVVALLFLLVVTVISVIAASNSSQGLKMSANLQDSYSSFQSAEAGIIAVLALAKPEVRESLGADDPFYGGDTATPFSGTDPSSTHPLRNLNDGTGSVDVDVFLTHPATECPPMNTSSGMFACEYYRVTSEHEVRKKARTKVELGVVKPIIGTQR